MKSLRKSHVFRVAVLSALASLIFVAEANRAGAIEYGCTGRGRYGAIAYSESSGRWGSSYNYQTLQHAIVDAVNRCGEDDCTVKVWFKNACGAFARGRNGVFGWGWAGSRGEAEQRALFECEQRGEDCEVLCWACTDR